jgi:hypothetical protein
MGTARSFITLLPTFLIVAALAIARTRAIVSASVREFASEDMRRVVFDAAAPYVLQEEPAFRESLVAFVASICQVLLQHRGQNDSGRRVRQDGEARQLPSQVAIEHDLAIAGVSASRAHEGLAHFYIQESPRAYIIYLRAQYRNSESADHGRRPFPE